MSEPLPSWYAEIGLQGSSPPRFFRSAEELDLTHPPPPQTHALRRAFQRMGLDGILCFANAPVVYFKVVSEFRPEELRQLQLRVWNQGLAPVLVVLSPKEVRVYSASIPPSQAENDGLVRTLDRVANALELRQLALSLESGEFFRMHGRAFDPDLRVDRRLLENLAVAREQMQAVHKDSSTHRFIDALLCRVVFTCYLVDREVISATDLQRIARGAAKLKDFFADGRSLREAGRLLYNLFRQLQEDFNGDLFGDIDREFLHITESHLEVLRGLLSGEELASGQLSFLDYDFGVIPIEAISAIYEHFLDKRRETGAIYTPRLLADVVIDLATEGFPSLLERRFLDPACGSGIFLVGLFHRMAEELRRCRPEASYDEHADALLELLRNNLFGIDSNETACRIAAFSLYLALLDQLDPPDIRRLQKRGKFLPPLVFRLDQQGKPGAGSTILHASFGQADPALPLGGFDLVIGNPPWVSRGRAKGESTRIAEEWPLDPAVPVAQKQVAQRFLWKAPRHLRNGGVVCFLLPHGILFNHERKALEFQYRWVNSHYIQRVVNLSDLRYQLFEGAIRPALIIMYSNKSPNICEEYRTISYATPKTSWLSFLSDVVVINPDDQREVDLRRVLQALEHRKAPTIWKERLWGTPRDWKLLDRLSMLPPLGEIVGQAHQKERKRWIAGQGFQPLGPNDKLKGKEPWSPKECFVKAKAAFDLLLFESDCRPPDSGRLRRKPEADEIFDPPHVLVTKGMKVAFASFRVIFQHAVQGINGPVDDEDLLRFLAVVLRSPLAHYFLFHTVANWGSERPEVHLEELLRLPFHLPEQSENPVRARQIVQEIASEMRELEESIRRRASDREVLVSEFIKKVSLEVYEYFDIDDLERMLIEDTVNVFISSVTPKRLPVQLRRAGEWRPRLGIPALDPSTLEARGEYLALLCGVLNGWAEGSGNCVVGDITISSSVGLGLVRLQRSLQDINFSNRETERTATAKMEEVLQRIQSKIAVARGALLLARDLKMFEGPTLTILKPLSLRYWTRTAALNDADEIAAAILGRTRT